MNALWYIDGHTLNIEKESSRKFSDSIKKLLTFNRPEKSKHQKYKISNLSRHKPLEMSMALKQVVQALQFHKSNKWGIMNIDFRRLLILWMSTHNTFQKQTKK